MSTISLCAAIVLIAWISMPWIGPRAAVETWKIGGVWLALTLAFEFLAGHFLFGNSWAKLLADYNVAKGRIWIFVPIITLLAPRWAASAWGAPEFGEWFIGSVVRSATILIACCRYWGGVNCQ